LRQKQHTVNPVQFGLEESLAEALDESERLRDGVQTRGRITGLEVALRQQPEIVGVQQVHFGFRHGFQAFAYLHDAGFQGAVLDLQPSLKDTSQKLKQREALPAGEAEELFHEWFGLL
jgi:hypothetical protein